MNVAALIDINYPVVHHVGGRGLTTTVDLPNSFNVIFEADPEAFEEMKQQATASHNILNYALGATRCRKPFYVLRNGYASSFYEPDQSFAQWKCDRASSSYAEMLEVVKVIDLEVHTLDEVIKKEYLLTPDVISLDTQGSELDILRGAEQALSKCRAVISEVEFVQMYKKQPLFADVKAFLADKGFMFAGMIDEFTIYRPGESRLGFGDALFLK